MWGSEDRSVAGSISGRGARPISLVQRTENEAEGNQVFSKRGTLAVACLATAMLMLDIAVVNTALPRIATDLRSGLDGLQWIVDACTLALATVVLTVGSLADRLGRRRPFAARAVIFPRA